MFCGDFDRAVSWFAAPGLVGLLDVQVLDVWMFRFLLGKRLFGCSAVCLLSFFVKRLYGCLDSRARALIKECIKD